MSESKELVLVSLPSAPADLEAAFISDQYISDLIAGIREKASSVVGDVNTVKGRGVYISMASNVRKTKTAIDDAGKALVADMKKRPAMVDASRKKVREALDELAIEIRKPATEWEADQARIAAEKAAEEERLRIEAEEKAALEALKKEIEVKHENALLMNEKFDRDVADAKAEAERQRIAHEAELKRQAEENAKRDLEQRIQREREEGIRRETELRLKAEAAERQRIEDAAQTERNRIEAAQKAEREKQQAIEETQRKAQQDADRIRLETEAKESRRLAEEKRVADEAAKRAADVEHQRGINRAVFDGLVSAGIPDEWALACVKAIALGKVPNAVINY